MTQPTFLTRVVLRNYKSIGFCDVRLQPLTYLVGANGSGKSNFLDALHFLRDALSGSLDLALNVRGGLSEVSRRTVGHPLTLGIRVEFVLADGRAGYYAVSVAARPNGVRVVEHEECAVDQRGGARARFRVDQGVVAFPTDIALPALTADRLALVAFSGLAMFRPVYDALSSMGFYNFDTKVMRQLQTPQDGSRLAANGENIASVIGHLEQVAPTGLERIREYMQTVVPSVQRVNRVQLGQMETVMFQQERIGSESAPWKFHAQNMSDGTLRALGVLAALFQSNPDHRPSLVGIEEPETALHPAASAALREALGRAAEETQVIVTSHSPDLLGDPDISAESLLAVETGSEGTRIAQVDEGARTALRDRLFSAGELLKMNQLTPDPADVYRQNQSQGDLFGESRS
jgi:predicted ATPase